VAKFGDLAAAMALRLDFQGYFHCTSKKKKKKLSAMDVKAVGFWKKKAVWCIHSSVLTCHLQACILVDWPSVVK